MQKLILISFLMSAHVSAQSTAPSKLQTPDDFSKQLDAQIQVSRDVIGHLQAMAESKESDGLVNPHPDYAQKAKAMADRLDVLLAQFESDLKIKVLDPLSPLVQEYHDFYHAKGYSVEQKKELLGSLQTKIQKKISTEVGASYKKMGCQLVSILKPYFDSLLKEACGSDSKFGELNDDLFQDYISPHSLISYFYIKNEVAAGCVTESCIRLSWLDHLKINDQLMDLASKTMKIILPGVPNGSAIVNIPGIRNLTHRIEEILMSNRALIERAVTESMPFTIQAASWDVQASQSQLILNDIFDRWKSDIRKRIINENLYLLAKRYPRFKSPEARHVLVSKMRKQQHWICVLDEREAGCLSGEEIVGLKKSAVGVPGKMSREGTWSYQFGSYPSEWDLWKAMKMKEKHWLVEWEKIVDEALAAN